MVGRSTHGRLASTLIAICAGFSAGCQAPAPSDPAPALSPVEERAQQVAELHEAGLELLAAGQVKQAVRAFQRELQLDPTRHQAHFQLGLCYYRLGHYGLEVAEYKKCLAIRPHLAHVLKNLGHAEFAADDLEGARVAYEAYLELEPHDGPVTYNLGLIAYDLGDLEAARELFRRCLQLGNNARARDHLRELERQQREREGF